MHLRHRGESRLPSEVVARLGGDYRGADVLLPHWTDADVVGVLNETIRARPVLVASPQLEARVRHARCRPSHSLRQRAICI